MVCIALVSTEANGLLFSFPFSPYTLGISPVPKMKFTKAIIGYLAMTSGFTR